MSAIAVRDSVSGGTDEKVPAFGGLLARRAEINEINSGTVASGLHSAKSFRQTSEYSLTAPASILWASSSSLIGPTGTSLIETCQTASGPGSFELDEPLVRLGLGPACDPLLDVFRRVGDKTPDVLDGKRDELIPLPSSRILWLQRRQGKRTTRPATLSSEILYLAPQLSHSNFIDDSVVRPTTHLL